MDYLKFDEWMSVAFPSTIRPWSNMPQIPWGPSTRQAFKGFYNPKMNIAQGNIDASQQLTYGGVVPMATLTPMNIREIIRCTILAIRRRTELMGPLCQIDPTTAQLVASLTARPAPPNHWSRTWVEVELAMALLASGRQTQAMSVSPARSWPPGSTTIPSPRPYSWNWAAWPCCAATTTPPRDRSPKPRSPPCNIPMRVSWKKRSATGPSRTWWPTIAASIRR